MTIGIPNTTQQLSPILKNIISGQNATQPANRPQTNPSVDTFSKETSKKENNEVKVAIINAIGRLAPTIALLAFMPNIISKMMKSVVPKTGSKEVTSVWQDINNALKISEMSLPDSLKKLFEKITKNIENPTAIQNKGGKPIKRILLYGPPGTGKTTFAKAIANQFPNSRFASLDVTDLNSFLAGETEKNIRAAVNTVCKEAQANPNTKFFVFIDEIDSVMMVDDGNSKKYSNNVLNEVKKCLTERLGKYDNIITIGATNLDINPQKATTMGGKLLDTTMLDRFQEKIYVGLPSKGQIKDFFIANYKNKPQVAEELQYETSERIDLLCEFLSNKKHNVSFRTLEGIFNDTATVGDINEKTIIADVFKVIQEKQKELNIDDSELMMLKASLNL